MCEVPDWGVMLPADLVLADMRRLGIEATELGPPGFLPEDPASLRAVLAGHGLGLAGAFVPVVMHDPAQREATLAEVRRVAEGLAAVGGDPVLVSAAVVDLDWAPRRPLGAQEWGHVLETLGAIDSIAASCGVRHVLHPHVGTLVETAEDVVRVSEDPSVRWCLDTGHLTVGGTDPVDFARRFGDRVGHVHLKDADVGVAARVRSGELNLKAAVQRGLFRPLGDGDVAIDQVVSHLESSGYAGWYVLEQDIALPEAPPADGVGPAEAVRRSLDYLRRVLGETERDEASSGSSSGGRAVRC